MDVLEIPFESIWVMPSAPSFPMLLSIASIQQLTHAAIHGANSNPGLGVKGSRVNQYDNSVVNSDLSPVKVSPLSGVFATETLLSKASEGFRSLICLVNRRSIRAVSSAALYLCHSTWTHGLFGMLNGWIWQILDSHSIHFQLRGRARLTTI